MIGADGAADCDPVSPRKIDVDHLPGQEIRMQAPIIGVCFATNLLKSACENSRFGIIAVVVF